MVPSLEGLAPFQIAFVVRDLERAARAFDAVLSAGCHHVAYVVESLQQTTTEMEAAGHAAIAISLVRG
jgi:hypothetical protein